MNKKIIIYALLVISFIFSIFVGGKFPFLLFFLVILTLIYSFLSNYYNKKNLQGVFWVNKYNFQRGENLKVEYKLYNSGLLPIAYMEVDVNIDSRLIEKRSNPKVFFIKPFDYILMKKEIVGRRRGIYDIGILDIKIEDIFLIKKSKFNLKDSLKIKIYPRIYEIRKMNLFGKDFFGTDKSEQKANEDYSNIRNLREYNPGDSIRKIHWKTSARRGKFFVKNFDASSKLKIKIFMDFEKKKLLKFNYILEEIMVEITSSIVHFTLKNNIETELISYGNKKIKINLNNIEMFDYFLETMVDIKPVSNRKTSDILSEETNISLIGSTILIVTVEIDEKMMDSIFNIKKMGINMGIFIVKTSYSKSEESRIIKLKELNINVYKIDGNSNIEKILGDGFE